MNLEKRKGVKTNIELLQSIRGSWGAINPVTRIERNKKKYTRKEKYRKKLEEE